MSLDCHFTSPIFHRITFLSGKLPDYQTMDSNASLIFSKNEKQTSLPNGNNQPYQLSVSKCMLKEKAIIFEKLHPSLVSQKLPVSYDLTVML